ncbi:MAG TPA: hypothetical protein VGE45_02710 [Chloroflexia bacterium]|jgi:hypothetical protein
MSYRRRHSYTHPPRLNLLQQAAGLALLVLTLFMLAGLAVGFLVQMRRHRQAIALVACYESSSSEL